MFVSMTAARRPAKTSPFSPTAWSISLGNIRTPVSDWRRSGSTPNSEITRVMMWGARGRRAPFPSAVISLAFCGVLLAAATLAGEAEEAGTAPQARLAATDYDFGEVRQGQTVSHDFLVRNLGNGVLRAERA